MVDSILIANRGEIALRVIRTARAMGIRTVAVYSDADIRSPHVTAADVAVRLGPAPATESYLNVAAVLGAAREAGADAVHPGYGFLSENAGFAQACQKAGLTFVGPPAEVISALGRKDAARELAEQADVPVLRAYRAAEVPQDVFPVLVKAASGGGGKGMRIVRAPAELPDALQAAEREAESAFGDGTVLVERYLEHGRHVEVQILADGHGNVVHLGERDCSVQRRHQKVVEESPAPTISPELRERLLDAAVRLCRKVGYVNAGTVEFIVSGDEFFFLEVNTRLQVEHSVTELVTGLDLVELQIRIARGERLPRLSARPDGHAIEVRVYAEDAEHGFLPQAGTAETVRWPSESSARVDTALRSGGEVTAYYDPMVAKVTAHGVDREAARRNLLSAIEDTEISGLTTNLPFLRTVLGSAEFADAAIDTSWLDTHPDLPFHPRLEPDGPTPFDARDGWRLGGPALPARAHAERIGASEDASTAPDGSVRAPMPGTVLAVKVHEGQTVTAGEPLGVLEAMKMEHTMLSPSDGVVSAVGAEVGDQVPLGHELFHVEVTPS
ncbi:acetyl/propionyl/methylcrotonyl-CoA carboxylase subunit alpha [Actinospica sp.]|jgi:acetyl/propionyl-CoA carboxylase alpha subunit|uniref:acetyl/propionyl/methylcrotonyl-CoA carboxylase subunit alpha n=1 Tax=Actinospica sp. TaxID=1872142 RepID=UPI002CCBD52F|nr:biotin carboxylase N-terminal domain-containing protein [Actinospica sp.]HWG24318.1 biotin carboxylase N-terminal domain-containing protein [Actinospica sp.]